MGGGDEKLSSFPTNRGQAGERKERRKIGKKILSPIVKHVCGPAACSVQWRRHTCSGADKDPFRTAEDFYFGERTKNSQTKHHWKGKNGHTHTHTRKQSFFAPPARALEWYMPASITSIKKGVCSKDGQGSGRASQKQSAHKKRKRKRNAQKEKKNPFEFAPAYNPPPTRRFLDHCKARPANDEKR